MASGSKRTLTWVLAAVVAAAALYLAIGRGGGTPASTPSTTGVPRTPATTGVPRTPAGGATAKRQKLSVGVLPDGESDIVYLAAALGYFEDEGLDVELARFKRGRRGLASLEDGSIDVAIAGDIALATDALSRTAHVVFATVGHADEHLLVVARKDRGVAGPDDLRGKRVGIESRMNPRYLTHRFLVAHGLDERVVELVEMKLKKLPGALGRGGLDAIVDPLSDNHPTVRKMTSTPGVELVTFAEPGSYKLSFEALATRALATTRPSALRAFVRALLHALDHARAHKEEAERTLAEALQVEGSRVSEDWSHTTVDVSLDRELVDTLQEIERWGRDAKYVLGEKPPIAGMIYADALRAERPAAVTLAPPP